MRQYEKHANKKMPCYKTRCPLRKWAIQHLAQQIYTGIIAPGEHVGGCQALDSQEQKSFSQMKQRIKTR